MFIVIYDDDDCLCIPQSWDKDCDGAICSGNREDAVAVFNSRSDARKAIDISSKFAVLCRAQGKPANEDFLGECRKHLRIIPLQPNAPVSGGTPSAPVGCSADFCETRIAVESAMKHRGQWDDTPRRPYPQNGGVDRTASGGC